VEEHPSDLYMSDEEIAGMDNYTRHGCFYRR
jgi:hypothetical protein